MSSDDINIPKGQNPPKQPEQADRLDGFTAEMEKKFPGWYKPAREPRERNGKPPILQL